MEVTAGLAESNGSLMPGLWRDSLQLTCGMTACTPGSSLGPMLGNEYHGKNFTFTLCYCITMSQLSTSSKNVMKNRCGSRSKSRTSVLRTPVLTVQFTTACQQWTSHWTDDSHRRRNHWGTEARASSDYGPVKHAIQHASLDFFGLAKNCQSFFFQLYADLS